MKKILIFLIVTLLIITGAQAVNKKHPNMDTTNSIIGCRIDMTTSIIDAYMDEIPLASDLEEHKTKLNDDKSKLNEHNTNEEWREFWAYRLATYAPNQRRANIDVLAFTLKWRKYNLTPEVLSDLKAIINTSRKGFQTCQFDSWKAFGLNRYDVYTEDIAKLQAKIDTMVEKNPDLNTDGMDKVIDDSNDFADEYNDAVQAASDGREMFEAIRGYCAFNGCPMGKNFHFHAKFNLAKQEAILGLISTVAIEAGLEEMVDEAQSSLDDASSAIDDIGFDNYNFETSDLVWNHLRQANNKIKAIVAEMR